MYVCILARKTKAKNKKNQKNLHNLYACMLFVSTGSIAKDKLTFYRYLYMCS